MVVHHALDVEGPQSFLKFLLGLELFQQQSFGLGAVEIVKVVDDIRRNYNDRAIVLEDLEFLAVRDQTRVAPDRSESRVVLFSSGLGFVPEIFDGVFLVAENQTRFDQDPNKFVFLLTRLGENVEDRLDLPRKLDLNRVEDSEFRKSEINRREENFLSSVIIVAPFAEEDPLLESKAFDVIFVQVFQIDPEDQDGIVDHQSEGRIY